MPDRRAPDPGAARGLLERVEAAMGPDRGLDYAIWFFDRGEAAPADLADIWPDAEAYDAACPAYTASLDAAVALVERAAPHLDIYVFSDCGGHFARLEDFVNTQHVRYVGFEGDGVGRELWPCALLSALLRCIVARPAPEDPDAR